MRSARCADNGATVNELMALFGQKTERIAMHYVRKADRKRLAAAAAHKLQRTLTQCSPATQS